MKNNIKKIIAAVLAAVIGLTGCNADRERPPVSSDDFNFGSAIAAYENGASNTSDGSSTDSSGVQPSGSAFQGRGTYMSLTGDGDIEINRNVKLGNTPMGKEGTWTIFVYLCGSDLESRDKGGYATLDMEEMLAASTGENVRFVVETGGASRWYYDAVDSSELGRYEICNGHIKKVDKQPDASMGASNTLADFLKWGVSNYPAAHMGVVLWNHGGGSIVGVCSDETWDRDILRLTEIDAAFAAASEVMTDKFEFVGFDACLMATVECANILSPYADYMYGSEELEAGYGWDYAAIGNYLGKNPTADGEELGRVVCDSFFDMLKKINADDKGTLSVTDLSKMDKLIKSYHAYTKELDSAAKDVTAFAGVVRKIINSDTFGSNSRETGFTNMVDIGGIVSASDQYSDKTAQVLAAIDEAVVYNRTGKVHEEACGLSTYYPLGYRNGQAAELEIFSDIAVTPYYLSFVTRTAYGLAHNGDMSGYVEQEVVDEWSDTWSEEETSETDDNYWVSLSNAQAAENSQYVQFTKEPGIYDGWDYYPKNDKIKIHTDGLKFGFSLTDQSAENIVDVRMHRWQTSPDGKYLLDLGHGLVSHSERYSDNEGNMVDEHDYVILLASPRGDRMVDYFSSYTVHTKNDTFWSGGSSLGTTSEPIACYFGDNNTLVPVTVNGVDAYFTGRSIWYGSSDDGVSDRTLTKLTFDDEVIPRFNAISLETGEETTFYGIPISFYKDKNGDPFVTLDTTSKFTDVTYYVNFEIIDAFGNNYMTDYARIEKKRWEPTNYSMVSKDTFRKVG